MAPKITHIKAIVPLMFILKWIATAIANIKKPADAIIWILALNFARANAKQVILDIRMPIKKKYNSGISSWGKTRIKMRTIITLFMSSGILRSLTVSRWNVSTLLIVLSK